MEPGIILADQSLPEGIVVPKFAANLSFLFAESPFLERFELAAAQGFRGVEFLFPYEWPATVLARALADAGLEQVLFNLPAGDWGAGERGIASHPNRQSEFRSGLLKALDYAQTLSCRRLHVLAGLSLCDQEAKRQADIFRANLHWAADQCAAAGVTLLIEPINSRVDMPGYWLDQPSDAFSLQADLAHPALQVQLDLYHAVVMGYAPLALLEQHIHQIGHLQIADYPGRHQPGTGEIEFLPIFQWLDSSVYSAWVGCEYQPVGLTSESFDWFVPFRGASS